MDVAGKGGYDIFNLGESATVSLSKMVKTKKKYLGKSDFG
jgi:hypothetical protein